MKAVAQVNGFYLFNSFVISAVILAAITMFLVQFKVESLQSSISKTKKEISLYKDQIKMLDVEWAYLTRPERLRKLSAKYLEDNNFVVANQIKHSSDLEEVYFANYQAKYSSEMAMR